jgi:glycosyltransferase involved in cell wall biosynthesis
MRVGLVVQLLERTPPVRYGAVERIVAYLADGLVARGHDVTLFASGDSLTSARLVAATDRSLLHDPEYVGELWWPHAIQHGQVVAMQGTFDVINSHAGYSFLPLLHALRVPVVSTWHGRVDRPISRAILRTYSFAPLIALSNYQRTSTEDLGLTWLSTIYNGVPTSELEYCDRVGEYLLFLGRIAPDKHPEVAIEVASRAGQSLRLVGRSTDRDYFDAIVRPLLKRPRIEYLGELEDEEKVKILSRALALVHPSDWEACSVAMVEALGSGTPVICFRRCGNAEIVTSGITGIVCDSLDEMVEACGIVERISRRACRDSFERRFSADLMVDQYVATYEMVHSLGGGPADRAAVV